MKIGQDLLYIQVTPKEKREWENENWTRLIGHTGFTKGKKGNGEMKIGLDLLYIQVAPKEKGNGEM